MWRHATAAILVAGGLLSVAVEAEELGAPGEAVLARVERPGGDRFEITVTPPPDRGVDRKVMEWATDTGVEAEDASAADADALDVSGYRIRVEKVAGSANCTAQYDIKSKPANLGANKAWVVESSTATSVGAAAFPTKGDVDIYIYVGSGNETCAKSVKKKQNMDYAGCIRSSCSSSATDVAVEVGNHTTSTATAVAVFSLVFVTTP